MSSTITIDKAGRIVLPKPLRDQFRLKGGAKLRIESVGDHLELTPEQPPQAAPLKRSNGLWVVAASGNPCDALDALEALEADRKNRELSIVGH